MFLGIITRSTYLVSRSVSITEVRSTSSTVYYIPMWSRSSTTAADYPQARSDDCIIDCHSVYRISMIASSR